jgi:hypothetical protein
MMSFEQIFATGPFAFDQIGHRVESKTVYAEVEPELEHLECGGLNFRVIVIEIGLMKEKPMPEI